MRKGIRVSAILTAAASCLLTVHGLQAAVSDGPISVDWGRERKKVLAFGWEWNGITPKQILEHADQFDEMGTDGIGLYIKGFRKDGTRALSSAIMDGATWTWDMIEDQVGDLRKATRHRGLRECFIKSLGAPTKRIDWRNDAHWAKVASSMALLARFARETGVRGFSIDPEDYHRQNQFKALPDDEPYDVLAPLARQRARELFSAAFREKPDLYVIGAWLLSWNVHHVASENPMESARTSGDLWPAFVNGIIDVMPPTAKLIDGNEWAYENEASDGEFRLSTVAQRNALYGLVAPENRTKFRTSYEPGFGLYLDSYVNARTNSKGRANHYWFGEVNGSRLKHFERNLSEAIECAGEYVWIWAEAKAWIKWPKDMKMPWGVDRELWRERLPGLNSMIRAANDPDAFFEKDFDRLLKEGKIVNVATNDYVAASAAAIRYKGKGDRATGSGYFHVCDPTARSGEHYAVILEGSGDGLEAVVFWQRRKTGWWRWRVPGHGLALRKCADGKTRARTVVRVPEGVDCLAIQFRLHPPKGKKCAFEKVFVGKINY